MPQVETDNAVDKAQDEDVQEDESKSAQSGDDKGSDDEGGADTSKSDSSEDDASDTEGADDKDAGADKSKPVDGDDRKNQNRLGFQLRQIRTHDPYVAQVRRNLQENFVGAADLTAEQREIRQLKANEYIKDVETKRAQLVADNAQIASEIPMFDPNSPEFNKKLYDRSLQRFGRDSLEQDDDGEITGYKVGLLDYMREEADSYRAMVEDGASKKTPTSTAKDAKADGDETKDSKPKKQTTDADRAKMDASSETAGGTSPATGESKKDPLIEAFFSGFDSVK